MAPSPTSLAHAVAAVLLRQEANTRSLIGIFTANAAEAEKVAAELRALSEAHSSAAQLLNLGEGHGLPEALEAAAECLGAGGLSIAEPAERTSEFYRLGVEASGLCERCAFLDELDLYDARHMPLRLPTPTDAGGEHRGPGASPDKGNAT